MKVLFIHQNFPGQFLHLASALGANPEHQVVALFDEKNRADLVVAPGVRVLSYSSPARPAKESHPYTRELETAARRGQAVARLLLDLKKQQFIPDIVYAHAGWGEAMFIREIFPAALVLGYFEFYYHSRGADVGFDLDIHRPTVNDACRLHVRNATHLLSLDACDHGVSPTEWQASQFPPEFRSKLTVLHEGIDTDRVAPDASASFKVDDTLTLTSADSVLTFVNRNLEPYRGFHVFMRALPAILADHPDTHVVLVGGDAASYGYGPRDGGSWKQKMLDEVGSGLDLARVHFVGKIPYERYLQLLQVSTAHVYLTYPFVLSWSMLEAMAAECLLIASDTQPVSEVITHGKNGLLVDFFDHAGLAAAVGEALRHPDRYRSLRREARATIEAKYDLKRVCLPAQMKLLESLRAAKTPSP